MSLSARKELVASLVARYATAKRKEKQRILNEFIAVTNYHRKYAIAVLNISATEKSPSAIRVPCQRRRLYKSEVKEVLIKLWRTANQLCAKRLVPFLPELIMAMERHGHLTLTDEIRALLLKISPATVDRLLFDIRHPGRGRAIGTTKAGSLLKHQIPIRTFADWNDLKLGFMEADLVAHCGTSTQGAYINTLVLTDIATGWTECLAILFRGQEHVMIALNQARQLLPFPLLGLDTDNGSEFLNNELFNYCKAEQITFTRCRPYKKNDQRHVEQENGSIVRKLIGYDRYEGAAACKQLATLYGVLRLYINFFQPSLKLVSKHRTGSKVTKKYDQAQTPFQRVIAATDISDEAKESLRAEYLRLDPVELLKQLELFQDLLWQYAHRPANSPYEALTTTAVNAAIINQPPMVELRSNAIEKGIDNFPRRYRSTPKQRDGRSSPRHWRTRKDPFDLVNDQIYEQLELNPHLEVKSLFNALQCRYPGLFKDANLRTLQRRVKEWRLARSKFCEGVLLPETSLLCQELTIAFIALLPSQQLFCYFIRRSQAAWPDFS
ncbi:MAG: transposase family protein [Acidobacteriota bacterium]